MTTTIIDTGPLVAYLDVRDQYHEWARDQMANLNRPFFSCEAVISEAHFLLQSSATVELVTLLDRRVINLSFSCEVHLERVNELMRTYENVPMSFADACLVSLYELQTKVQHIFTTDSDFAIYRDKAGKPLNLLLPK